MRTGRVVGGLVLVALGVLLLLGQAGVHIPRGVALSAALICVGIGLLLQVRRPASTLLLVGGVILVVILAADERPAGPLRVEVPGAGPTRTASDSFTVDSAADAVELEVDAASVSVTAGDGPVAIDWQATYRSRRPTVRSDVDDQVIEVDAECPGTAGIFGGDCRMDIEISVPRGMDVGIDSGSGTVSVEGAVGNVSVETGSGAVTGHGLEAREARIETGSGPVRLTFTGRAPDLVDVSTGSGSVQIEVPPDAYRIVTDTGSGAESVEGVVNDPDAGRTITVDTGSGSISILSRRPAPTPPPTAAPTPDPTPEL